MISRSPPQPKKLKKNAETQTPKSKPQKTENTRESRVNHSSPIQTLHICWAHGLCPSSQPLRGFRFSLGTWLDIRIRRLHQVTVPYEGLHQFGVSTGTSIHWSSIFPPDLLQKHTKTRQWRLRWCWRLGSEMLHWFWGSEFGSFGMLWSVLVGVKGGYFSGDLSALLFHSPNAAPRPSCFQSKVGLWVGLDLSTRKAKDKGHTVFNLLQTEISIISIILQSRCHLWGYNGIRSVKLDSTLSRPKPATPNSDIATFTPSHFARIPYIDERYISRET